MLREHLILLPQVRRLAVVVLIEVNDALYPSLHCFFEAGEARLVGHV